MLNCHPDTVHLFTRKAGQGCTVTAALLATLLVRRNRTAAVYDAAPRSDLAAALGLPEPFGKPSEISPAVTLYRLESLDAAAKNLPAAAVIDWGTTPVPDKLDGRRYVVTSPCYLALRAANTVATDGVVVVEEPGHALNARDVAQAVKTPIAATITRDPAVTRSVDAGLLLSVGAGLLLFPDNPTTYALAPLLGTGAEVQS